MRGTADPTDLTASQMSVLGRLEQEGDASVGELAVVERVRHQSMAATVAALEQRGLVSRRADPADGRRQVVSTSEAGHRFHADRRRAGDEWLSRALEEQLTETERQTVIEAMALLERVAR
ncbi:MarR family winged helix-turn-helix transcriptional regulator [Embleya sp. AB8]|uniref:MarR family winged helix-turn-helix transcriptional regulator n=1 Tax=Embleya sp. AB8 TaxID=3156304 RepID=UPI003C78C14A